MSVIKMFRGNYYFLSNMFEIPVVYKGITFGSSEAAFQSQKQPEVQESFVGLTGKEAKAKGKKVELREDYDDVKVQLMIDVLMCKFTQHGGLREKLIATGDVPLVEGNWWNDTYWGFCRKKGRNMLGKILMDIRDSLKVGDEFIPNYSLDTDYIDGYALGIIEDGVKEEEVHSEPVVEEPEMSVPQENTDTKPDTQTVSQMFCGSLQTIFYSNPILLDILNGLNESKVVNFIGLSRVPGQNQIFIVYYMTTNFIPYKETYLLDIPTGYIYQYPRELVYEKFNLEVFKSYYEECILV